MSLGLLERGVDSVLNGDIAVIEYHATVVDGADGAVVTESGRMRLRAGDCGAVGGIDVAVVGMTVGQTKEMVIPPELAFGQRDPSLVMVLPRGHFGSYPNLKAGSLLKLRSEGGSEIEVVTRKVSGDTVTVDANQPLAGMTLNFNMTVLSIERDGKKHTQ
jgi:FKBP-type peptidyl-prolyl cis-trans isomerase 2